MERVGAPNWWDVEAAAADVSRLGGRGDGNDGDDGEEEQDPLKLVFVDKLASGPDPPIEGDATDDDNEEEEDGLDVDRRGDVDRGCKNGLEPA